MKARSSRGFTLLEVVVVTVIVAILAGFITLSIGSRDTEDRMQTEAQRLQQLIELAAEESQLKGVQLGLQFTDQGYRFLTLDDKSNLWRPYQTGGPLRPRALPPPFRIELRIDDRQMPSAPSQQPPQKTKPQVLIYSSGQMTPFTAVLSAPDLSFAYRLKADALGGLKLEAETGS
ncbi:MAG: type II secretion system minor pseudopilin GspH [Gammaproteobacteria bacterium]|nr:type II secretion system minor pseudopilin GspH [Gammaproteobacteria bacterium]